MPDGGSMVYFEAATSHGEILDGQYYQQSGSGRIRAWTVEFSSNLLTGLARDTRSYTVLICPYFCREYGRKGFPSAVKWAMQYLIRCTFATLQEIRWVIVQALGLEITSATRASFLIQASSQPVLSQEATQ